MEDIIENSQLLSDTLKKKRGRKKKSDPTPPAENIYITFVEPSEKDCDEPATLQTETVAKKRGRKPKGGKLVIQPQIPQPQTKTITNVILHLKCSLSDLNDYNNKINQMITNPLEYKPLIPPDIQTYNDNTMQYFTYVDDNPFKPTYDANNSPTTTNSVNNTQPQHAGNTHTPLNTFLAYTDANTSHASMLCSSCNSKHVQSATTDVAGNSITEDDSEVSIKDINLKLKRLKINLYKNVTPDKKSACFWCTYDYDNLSCYIPKYEMDDKLYGYGSFCRPECAVAYLMKENLDDSTKFERYHLLNQIYSKVYDYKKNIKPAPNPYYLLEKFYGTLTIQEYRKLLKTEHMLLVLDKPLTRILPELHEDNEDLLSSVYGGNSINKSVTSNTGMYKVKRQSEMQNGPSKSSIIRDRFGISG
jgi:hypothetical protein